MVRALGSNKRPASVAASVSSQPESVSWRWTRLRTKVISPARADARISHNSASLTSANPSAGRPSPSVSNSAPPTRFHSSWALESSQVWTWMPLVTAPIGTSGTGHRGNNGANRWRLTSPWSWLTPLTAPAPRTAR